MLNFAEDITYFEFERENKLLLESRISPNERWSVAVRSREHDDDSHAPKENLIVKELSMQHIVGGYGREYVGYRLFADNVVRRWDGGDAYEKMQKDRELGISEPKYLDSETTREEVAQAAIEGLMRLTETYKNQKLEQSMGYKLQPIGLDELDGLGAWISAQELQPRKHW